MKTGTIVLIIVLLVLVAAVVALYFVGKKAQKKQEEQQQQIEAMKQTVSMLIIDKKRMKMKDAGLPQQVMDSANRFAKNTKLPVVKAKIGPQIMTLIADEKIFDSIPVKKEVKAETKDYSKMTVAELREVAKEQGVEGYTSMKKAELLEAIK